MPVFYPPIDFDEPPPYEKSGDHAEWDVLCCLQKLDDSWRIFHGIEWRYTDKFGEHKGEADVIVFHPDLGILFIEIKGGGVKLKDGVWYYLDLYDGITVNRMKQSPSTQAGKSQYYFEKRLNNTPLGAGILLNAAITHTSWFPDFEWNESIPPELPSGSFILDSRNLAQPEKHLRRILTQSHPNATPWNPKEIDILVRTIVPDLNLIPPLGVILGTIRDRLFRMTDGQVNALRALKGQKRLLVEGCAGSGKTLLAVRLAHEHLQVSKRVLLTCFNKNLAAYLATEFEGYKNIDVVNFHELVRNLCNRSGINFDVPADDLQRKEFFHNTCADLLSQVSLADEFLYDTIIVDEALDFQETWWIALESLSKNDSSFYAFYDWKQDLFTDKTTWQPPFEAEPIRLDTNVRNTKPVGEYSLKLGVMNEKLNYAVDSGPKPEVHVYTDANDMAQKVHALVTDLIGRRKVSPDEVVVLAPYKYDNTKLALKDLIDTHDKTYCTDMVSASGKIRVGTIQSFKGLESDVVILCGIDGNVKACKPSNLYVGASRARSLLYVYRHKSASIPVP